MILISALCLSLFGDKQTEERNESDERKCDSEAVRKRITRGKSKERNFSAHDEYIHLMVYYELVGLYSIIS